MTEPNQRAADVADSYWTAIEARNWDGLGELLADNVTYELPQTRERIRGRAAYVQFNQEYPGDWHATVERLTGSGRHAVTWTSIAVDGRVETGLTFLDLDDDGHIALITAFWPEPYEPPPGREHLAERW